MNYLPVVAEEITKKCIKDILLAHGIDLQDPNFRDTPERAGKAFSQFLKGYTLAQVQKIFEHSFPSKLQEMAIVRSVPTYGLCPHHLLPVEMKVWIGYIPKGRVLGLSKFRRLVKLISQKALLQEELTEVIADTIDINLKPYGVMVVIEGHHLCMSMRGIEQQDAKVTTSAVRGQFENSETRAEFLNLTRRVE